MVGQLTPAGQDEAPLLPCSSVLLAHVGGGTGLCLHGIQTFHASAGHGGSASFAPGAPVCRGEERWD